MRFTEEQKEIVSSLKNIYDSIQFYGVYTKYTRSISVLSQLLRLDDPSELHYVMMHLSRLSYLKDTKGTYVWSSERYANLVGCDDLAALISHRSADFLDEGAETKLQQMETQALQLQQISSDLIDTYLQDQNHFTCHVKVYPIYNHEGKVIASLGLLAEVASPDDVVFAPGQREFAEAAVSVY